MQTFLPYADFEKTARILDRLRLGKQRVECLQILRVINGIGKKNKNGKLGWENHTAVRMWRKYPDCLALYGMTICKEWMRRGYKDTCYDKIKNFISDGPVIWPWWIGDEKFHATHRSNLLRKDIEYYIIFGWTEPDNLEYLWPTTKGD